MMSIDYSFGALALLV